MTYETIRYEKNAGIGTLTLSRPDNLNGITNQMMFELYEALSQIALDQEVRVLILTGAGKAFCPGADLKHYSSGTNAPEQKLTKEQFRISVLLHEMPQVSIAAINGACAGAGLGWACACDLRFASENAAFNTAFLKVAVSGDMGGPWTVSRLVGAAKARELFFLADKFTASEAKDMGLITNTFPEQRFQDEISKIAERLTGYSPEALKGMKANFLAAERMSFADYLDDETDRHMASSSGPNAREAFRAFVEKREPNFS